MPDVDLLWIQAVLNHNGVWIQICRRVRRSHRVGIEGSLDGQEVSRNNGGPAADCGWEGEKRDDCQAEGHRAMRHGGPPRYVPLDRRDPSEVGGEDVGRGVGRAYGS